MTWSWPERPRRVVVTGMGAVTSLGQDVASTWDGLVAGRSGVAPITLFDPSRVSVKIAAEVKDFDPSGVLDRKEMRRTDRYIQFALVTARQALTQAGLPGRLDDAMAARTGVIVGSGLGGVATLFDNVLLMGERGPGPHLAVLHPHGASRTSPPGRSRSRPGPSAPTSRRCPPARRAATRWARHGRRSAAATPT